MSKNRRAAKVDGNQMRIVKKLCKIQGITVKLGHDDILVGYKGRTYWYEIKSEDVISKRTGFVMPSAIKKSQTTLIETWTGHYKIVWSAEQILDEIIG